MSRVRPCHYSTSLTPVYPIIMSSTGTCTTFVNFPYEAQHNSSLTGTFGRRNNTGLFQFHKDSQNYSLETAVSTGRQRGSQD